jgi:hypothetical protein
LDVLDGRNQINGETFDKFYVLEYDPSKDIIRYSREYIMKLEETQARLQRYRDHIDLIRLETALLSYERGEFDPSQVKSLLDELPTTPTPMFVKKHNHVHKDAANDNTDANDSDGDDEDDDDADDDADEEEEDDDGTKDVDADVDDDEYADGDGNDDCGGDSDEDDNYNDSDSGYDDVDGKDEGGDEYLGHDSYDVHCDEEDDDLDSGGDEIDEERDVTKVETTTTHDEDSVLVNRGVGVGLFDVYLKVVSITELWDGDPIIPPIRKPPDPCMSIFSRTMIIKNDDSEKRGVLNSFSGSSFIMNSLP